MKPLLLARFTPSLTAPEDLEVIFVQREPLAERLLSQLHDSLTTANKHHTLLVGPRGIGKTHLITLVQHRLVNRPDLRTRCLVAWLREEEWGVMSFLDLLLRILRSLTENREADVPPDRLEALHDLSPTRAEKEAAEMLREVIGDKTLVLLMENLDDIFRGLAQREQAAFRAFLQDHACITILATAPGLFDGVSRRQSPFFGFFRIHHLEELGFEEAAQLLVKIASRRGQNDLAAFILTPAGRARVRAIHHLAQGNPRVYIILSEFLTRQSLDELVDPVLRMLDDLTPYYQSRLSWLSPQQRKIVEFLASNRVPCVVKELARRCFISSQTASGQLRKLTEWGYVRSENVGRESHYELREPLMRFCLDLKKERKEPLRPLLDILRIWWTPDELELQLQRLDRQISPTAEYLAKALAICRKESNDPRVKACRRDFHQFLEMGQFEKALAVAEEWIVVSRNVESLFQLGYANMMLLDWEAASEALALATELDCDDFHVAWLSAFVAQQKGAFEESISLADKARSLAGDEADVDILASLLVVKAGSLSDLGNYDASIASCDELLRSGLINDTASTALKMKAQCLLMLGRFQEAETILTAKVQFPIDAGHYYLLGVAQYRLNRNNEALASIEKAIGLDDSVPHRLTRAKILAECARWEQVMPEIDSSLKLSPAMVKEWIPTLRRIALWAMMTDGGLRSFLTPLNHRLEAYGVPTINIPDLMTVASKEILSGDRSAVFERWSRFFEKISASHEGEHALTILETALQFIRNQDVSVLLRLPLEERQLIAGLMESESTSDASIK